MLVADADRCTRALSFDRLVPALAEAFAAGCEFPPRHVHRIACVGPGAGDTPGNGTGSDAASAARHDAGDAARGGTVLIMPAWTTGERGLLGIKVVNIYPGNATRGLPGLHATYTLFDATTGVPLAALDGNVITMRRTAATAALAASRLLANRYLAGEPVDLCIVGSGRVARWLPWAFTAVATLGSVRVWD